MHDECTASRTIAQQRGRLSGCANQIARRTLLYWHLARIVRLTPVSIAPQSAVFGLACKHVGEWLSLVEHLVRDQGVGGSNPLSPTILFNNIRWVRVGFNTLGFPKGFPQIASRAVT
jgi:hypothetical protein